MLPIRMEVVCLVRSREENAESQAATSEWAVLVPEE
jgi:hypothetical protein